MTVQSRRLPGGRGIWKGKDSYVGQNEAFVARAGQIPTQTGEILYSIIHNSSTGVSALNATNTIFDFIPVGVSTVESRMTHAFMKLISIAAGTVTGIEFGLYAFQRSSVWRLIPASNFSLVNAAVGLLKTPLDGECIVPKGTRWGLGWVKDTSWGATATFTSQIINANYLHRISRSTTATLPVEIDLQDGSFTAFGSVLPMVAYTPALYSEVIV